MAFLGLFIGIDRYQSPSINELACARRDAVALAAMFRDTLSGHVSLLVDGDATIEQIAAAFAELENCSPDDTVVITFSGHGTETHELVTFDTDIQALESTAIPLDALQDWFARIPATRLVLILDCCFSGGLGAKVLHIEDKPRDWKTTSTKLEQLAGDGRVIFTASGALEEAWEHSRYRHGLLTHFIIEALQGPPEIMNGDRISVFQLFDYVTEKVKAAANQIGRSQNPTVLGRIEGGLYWPIFEVGSSYREAFPERVSAIADTNLDSLRAFGFPDQLIRSWGEAIPSLNSLQLAAINQLDLLRGTHLLISAPTSSGKTMVGELAALSHCLERRRALFLLPLKALVADKRRHFQAVYGPFGIRVVEATGETDDIGPLIRGRYDIALLTYEKFAALVLTHPHLLYSAGIIVVDEVQMIADASRGANLEFILTLIRMRRREGIEPQVVALSAVIGDTGGFENWLGGRLLRRTERPVPLAEGVLREDGSFQYLNPDTHETEVLDNVVSRQYGKNSAQDWIIPLVSKLVGEGQQVIVFRETKGEARGTANYLANALHLPSADRALAELPSSDASQAHADLLADLHRGVAFHNADLQPIERRVIEEEFRRADSRIRVIAATTTLAMGVNTPAESVVIEGLEHPGQQAYSVAEYKNLVGRAGRLGFATKGTSYLLALDARAEHDYWRRYVTGQPEDLRSRFLDESTDPRSLIVRVLVASET